jgi:hypothetical protein
MLTTHGLFLTCTQKFHLYIYTAHNPLFGHNPLSPCIKGERKTPLSCLAHGGESPSTPVHYLLSTTLPLLSNLPSPPPTPLAHTILQWQHQKFQSSWSGTILWSFFELFCYTKTIILCYWSFEKLITADKLIYVYIFPTQINKNKFIQESCFRVKFLPQ